MKATDFHTTRRLAFEDLGRVHFVGIGGAGMSAIARILLARGVAVSGSDNKDSRTVGQLRDLGATVHIGHEAAHVAGADTVVVSTAIRPDNPELQAAAAAGLNIIHRSVALASAMGSQELIAVAGTHGKTTTTAMVTVMLQSAGREPSFAIGGDVAALGVNAAHGSGGLFVAEADESDGSFLNYLPKIIIVTNVEADHLDHYGTAESVYASFDSFAALLPPDGVLIACIDDPGARELAGRFRSAGAGQRIVGYGYADDADVRILDSRFDAASSSSILAFGGGTQQLTLQVPGEHNIRNAAAAFAAGLSVGLEPEAAAAGLARFTGAARRFEARGEAGGVRVFDDYAHHPTEVEAALRAAREVAQGHQVHVLFQPHLFSRTREFAAAFARALSLADSVAVLDIYPAREDPIPGVTSELITGRLETAGGYEPDPAQAVQAVAGRAQPGDIVMTVGAGDVTQYGAVLVDSLARRTMDGRH
ncbi:UDP-N-acetylmuramate--L-alanine ligase [Arthrobacter crystallopoietes BAB-32]|uniref:UDP-N-acetylmuramate--L-alanine ligase n=1 Tax=Arthrobacter crystallopoietes BAB-32 TaxID=1246476 RepID=N1V5T5_9MICC|nr:UDP-N-acetylmuramate--L-alanine ligase [Arthrobacter crystallopoietes]EMY33618.1 UDP-N-acetylmuramate--L-alanine ligase [Arthrobacter crystallopoietes BAB-32]